MKVIFAQTNYPGFLEYFYNKYPNWKSLTYKQIKNRWDKEWFGSSNFYLMNLRPLGVTGQEFIMNDWRMQSKWAKENGFKFAKAELPFFDRIPESIKNSLSLRNWVKQTTFNQIKQEKPDVLYLHDLSVFNSADIKKLKEHAGIIVGQIACPLPLNMRPLKYYDLIISSFPHYVQMFRKMGINSEYLRWCVEERIPKDIHQRHQKYNVSYVGGLTPSHRHGNKILEAVSKDIDVDIWGYGSSQLSKSSPIFKSFHGQAWGRQIYEIFSDSKIVINRHIDVSKNYANNMRMFDVTAMGSLLITDKKKNISEFFVEDKEIVTYRNSKDLIEKIKYYLSHEKERMKIASAGKKRTLKDHTYRVRMKELKHILERYMS